MQQKYKTTFEVPAVVEIELTLDADNQQDALVAGHDLILLATPAQGKVLSLNLQSAQNTDCKRVEAAGSAAPLTSPCEVTGQHTVRFFSGNAAAGEPAVSLPSLNYLEAKGVAESVRAEGSRFGYAEVLDQFGTVVLSAVALRGGWEAEALLKAGTAEHHSWLADRKEAMTALMSLLQRTDVKSVKVYDYTDRQLGPRLVREVQ